MPCIPIIPVLDVMNGVVVRAVGGKRSEYKPVVSTLTKSTVPLDVLKAMLDATGSDVAYVADLDSIKAKIKPSPAVLQLIERSPVELWIDFGIRFVTHIKRLSTYQNVVPILGFETTANPQIVWSSMSKFPNLIVSLDLRNGQILGNMDDMTHRDVAELFADSPMKRLLLIDVAAVGTGLERTSQLCREIKSIAPKLSVFPGGGIANRIDFNRFIEAEAAGVLVASALHDGTLP